MYSCNLLWSDVLINQGYQKTQQLTKIGTHIVIFYYGQLLLLMYLSSMLWFLFALQKMWWFCIKLCQQETISSANNFSLLPKFFSSVTKLQRCGWVAGGLQDFVSQQSPLFFLQLSIRLSYFQLWTWLLITKFCFLHTPNSIFLS